ncbi:dienelactone hydrolase family protein [uncultured Alsobacter sp.]|uniref:dienelactone hydrolase family protein n=1 Tax=uncultured Alsobacter sp. TaxID=1748258 RepID=UPI0025DD9530|nr:dienelactone hydrolase family protein [uncultured Alsobacter sp.]
MAFVAFSRAAGPRGRRHVPALALAAVLVSASGAGAQSFQTIAPPKGKGPPLLVVSGQSGPSSYAHLAKTFADKGFSVVLADGNDLFRSGGEVPFRAAVKAAQSAPSALPGPVGVVGFSLGGAAALTYGTRMAPDVAAVVAVYPFTAWIDDLDAFVRRVGVPTLVLAATQDSYRDCCLIATARALVKAGQAQRRPIRLVEYPQANHAFAIGGNSYRDAGANDAVRRTAAHMSAAGVGRGR